MIPNIVIKQKAVLEANLFHTKWTKKTKNTKQYTSDKYYYFFVKFVNLVSLCETWLMRQPFIFID